MTRQNRDGTNLVKFPIGRVVREHRIGSSQPTPELEAIQQAAVSIRRAIETLRRQEATLNLRAARARKKVTPEQQARAVEKNMRRLYAREDENRAAEAAAAPPPDAGTRRKLRELIDRWDAEAGRDGDDAA